MHKPLIFSLALCTSFVTTALAQKETYDVVSYNVPKGWKKDIKENGIQLYTGDEKTGEYSVVIIIKSTETTASASENFTNLWQKLIKGTVTVTNDPTPSEPAQERGWDIISGQANYTDGASKGLVTLVTATGNGKVAAVVLMANTNKHQTELLDFLHSLEIAESTPAASPNTPPPTSANSASPADPAGQTSIIGVWQYNLLETNGMHYANGSPMLSAGYFRKAYTFRADGTYLFQEKDWSVYAKEIFFAYETGTWTLSGNQLTITPAKGKNESWNKSASGRTTEWGSLLKTTPRTLEKITYSFGFHYYSGMNETHLLLKYNKDTERDGSNGNGNNNNENTWSYSPPHTPGVSIIDWPPGHQLPTN